MIDERVSLWRHINTQSSDVFGDLGDVEDSEVGSVPGDHSLARFHGFGLLRLLFFTATVQPPFHEHEILRCEVSEWTLAS